MNNLLEINNCANIVLNVLMIKFFFHSGLAKNLMNQFKNLESQKSSSYKPSGIGNKVSRAEKC